MFLNSWRTKTRSFFDCVTGMVLLDRTDWTAMTRLRCVCSARHRQVWHVQAGSLAQVFGRACSAWLIGSHGVGFGRYRFGRNGP